MNEHTPTPWAHCEEVKYPHRYEGHAIRSAAEEEVTEGLGSIVSPTVFGRGNAERIVACVNACEGIENPAAIPRVIQALEELVAERNLHGCHEDLPETLGLEWAREALAALRGDK